MSLLEKIKEILDQIEVESQDSKDALRRAEELSNKFSDIRPKTDIPSREQLMGLPAPAEKKSLFLNESMRLVGGWRRQW